MTYASRDPWAGSAALFETVPYIRQKGIRVTSLAGSPLETCLIALQADAHLRDVRTEKELKGTPLLRGLGKGGADRCGGG